ncbi:hypothetical protein GGR52DRAFT_543546 [Hypoxylon sp. FL1284]|nr:hypothetical protein GGR52DRAFT_543546 [Hypoxylon sp. FL1284]
MQKRRSHKKSRNGCQNCKKWHTKCDEQGPPCNNCLLRKARCVYSRPNESSSGNKGQHLSLRSPQAESASWCMSVDRPPGSIAALCAPYGGPGNLLSLELMHQWSTMTYKCFSGIPEDNHYLQAVLPRSALKYDFMLNCLMAVSSLHIARTVNETEAVKYQNAALEFYNRGSSSFRTNLGSINQDNCHVLYMFSAIAVAIHLAIPAGYPSVLSLATVTFDLLNGCTSIGMMAMPWMVHSPFPIRLFISRIGASKDLIDADARAAFARLRMLIDQQYKTSPRQVERHADDHRPSALAVNEHEFYELAVHYLEICYAEEAKGLLRGFCTTFPSMMGKTFISYIHKRDPFALLLLEHWAVLLDGIDPEFWWMTSIGGRLAQEIAQVLRSEHPDLALEWNDAISWPLIRLGSQVSPLQELSYNEESGWQLVLSENTYENWMNDIGTSDLTHV